MTHHPRGNEVFLKAQFPVFLVVGLLATATHYIVLWVGISTFQLKAVIASSVGFLFGALLNYLLNYYWTFNASQKHKVAIIRFLCMLFLSGVLNAFILGALISIGIALWLSQVSATVLLVALNYSLSKTWIFRRA